MEAFQNFHQLDRCAATSRPPSVCIENSGFFIKNDGFCMKDDGLFVQNVGPFVQNDGFRCIEMTDCDIQNDGFLRSTT